MSICCLDCDLTACVDSRCVLLVVLWLNGHCMVFCVALTNSVTAGGCWGCWYYQPPSPLICKTMYILHKETLILTTINSQEVSICPSDSLTMRSACCSCQRSTFQASSSQTFSIPSFLTFAPSGDMPHRPVAHLSAASGYRWMIPFLVTEEDPTHAM